MTTKKVIASLTSIAVPDGSGGGPGGILSPEEVAADTAPATAAATAAIAAPPTPAAIEDRWEDGGGKIARLTADDLVRGDSKVAEVTGPLPTTAAPTARSYTHLYRRHERLVTLVAQGLINSLYLTGTAGCGKTSRTLAILG